MNQQLLQDAETFRKMANWYRAGNAFSPWYQGVQQGCFYRALAETKEPLSRQSIDRLQAATGVQNSLFPGFELKELGWDGAHCTQKAIELLDRLATEVASAACEDADQASKEAGVIASTSVATIGNWSDYGEDKQPEMA